MNDKVAWSWIPVIIESPGGGHLHAFFRWEWNRPGRESTLPKGVHLAGMQPFRRDCELCQIWGAIDDKKMPARPAGSTPLELGDYRDRLMEGGGGTEASLGGGPEPEKSTENAPSAVEGVQSQGQQPTQQSFNDF